MRLRRTAANPARIVDYFAALAGQDADALAQYMEEHVAGQEAEKWFGPGACVPRLDVYAAALTIRDRGGTLVGLSPNAAQRQYARSRSRRNIILKARQVGMTTYIAARYFLETMVRPGTVTLQVAHTLEAAQQIFRIVHRFARHLPPDMSPFFEPARVSLREVSFPGRDSRYIVDTAGNRNVGRGLTLRNLHASEAALWPGDPAETMAGLLAAVAPGGQVDVESTPRGMGGWFHIEWQRATRQGAGAPESPAVYTPHFFPWYIEPAYRRPLSPGQTLEPWSDEERALLETHRLAPEQVHYRRNLQATFAGLRPQEFAENDAECFLLSGRPVFDVAGIEDHLLRLPPPIARRNNGAELVWFQPQPGRSYIIGADVAEGTESGDHSAAVVVDAETGLQCAELMARWPVHVFAEELARLGQRYHGALLAVERNNHGHAVLYALARQFGYLNLYQHREDSGAAAPGWPMNVLTKPRAIHALRRILAEAPEVIRSPRLLEQCRNFAYGPGGETGARPGMHDDLVIAAAIAWAVRAQAHPS